MQPSVDPPVMSGADAASRLRYVAGVQIRARRAVLAPSFLLVSLGALVLSHAALVAVWPRGAGVTIFWLAVIVAARPGLFWLRRRIEEREDLRGAMRLRLICAAAALTAAALAFGIGASPLVTAIAVATAVTAYLAGMPSVALAAVLIGVVGDELLANGVSSPVGELVFGAGLVVVGLICHATEHERA